MDPENEKKWLPLSFFPNPKLFSPMLAILFLAYISTLAAERFRNNEKPLFAVQTNIYSFKTNTNLVDVKMASVI